MSLLLASQSHARKQLLSEAKIPFIVVGHYADEQACDWTQPLEQVVKVIAEHKMAHVRMPDKKEEGTIAYVLTADTLTADNEGNLHGKPRNKEDALATIKLLRAGARVATAFCLDKKIFNNGVWQTQLRRQHVVTATCMINIPDHWLERYSMVVQHIEQVSGGMSIEGYGAQFVQSIQGSYTTILGLPLYEVRQALEEIGFFD